MKNGHVTNPVYREPVAALFRMTKLEYETLVEVMPPDTNRSPTIAGARRRIGGRQLAAGSCRDEIAAALRALGVEPNVQVFGVREVYQQMARARTRYAESTVLKTMQRMKRPASRSPFVRLERVGREGFRIASAG